MYSSWLRRIGKSPGVHNPISQLKVKRRVGRWILFYSMALSSIFCLCVRKDNSWFRRIAKYSGECSRISQVQVKNI